MVGGGRGGGDGYVFEEVDEVGAAGPVEVEEQRWMDGGVGEGGKVDDGLVPWRVGRVGGVVWGEEVGEHGVC